MQSFVFKMVENTIEAEDFVLCFCCFNVHDVYVLMFHKYSSLYIMADWRETSEYMKSAFDQIVK